MQETMSIGEAATYLGVSRTKIWTLIKEGRLTARQNPLDKREHLVPASAVQELRDQGKASGSRRRLPRVLDHGPVMVHSDEYEQYLTAHWRPA